MLERWLGIAEERLAGTDVRVFSDQPTMVALHRCGSRTGRSRRRSRGSGGRATCRVADDQLRLVESHAVGLSCAEAEGGTQARIEAEVRRIDTVDRTIFNLHVPPKDSQLDKAALLKPDLSPITEGGAPVLAGVGSTAVRNVIERHQPPLALHGHIHESRGTVRIGRTLCINPGSEYSDGILRGAVVTLSERGIVRQQLLSG